MRPGDAGLMIVPTWRAVALMAVGVPMAAVAGLMQTNLWLLGPAWIGASLVLIGVDALLMPRLRRLRWTWVVPLSIEAGSTGTVSFTAIGEVLPGLEVQLEADPLLDVTQGPDGFCLTPRRRGTAVLHRLHLRGRGRLDLVRDVAVVPLGIAIPVTLAISRVRDAALAWRSHARLAGAAMQPDRAESMEFHALRPYQPGDDTRQVSWRQSARHGALLVRETDAERNRTVMLAIDCGRLMGEPLAGGLPRLDHALHAALIMAYAGLRAGDRVGLFAFADRPVLMGGTVRNVGSFPALQRLAASVDYADTETNHTLGLTTLGGQLSTRALVVIMTDFADTTSAALMVEHVGRLIQRHLVLFVVFADETLTAMTQAAPDDPGAVSRAVIAGRLLEERELVLAQLRHIGVELVIASSAGLGQALVRRHATLKRQDRL